MENKEETLRETPQAPANAAAACGGPVPPAPRRVRRVGTFTMGAALVVAGVAICTGLFVPAVDLTFLFRLSPLVLVALGCEVLFASFTARQDKLRYDFLSMLVCFFLILGALCAACVPVLSDYYGPASQAAQRRVEQGLYDAAYTALAEDEAVDTLSFHVYFNTPHTADTVQTVADLAPGDGVSASVRLRGAWATEAEFAAACRRVADALYAAGTPAGAELEFFTLQTQARGPQYTLYIEGAFQADDTAEALAARVSRSTFVEAAGYYMDEDERSAWEAEQQSREAEWQAAMDEAQALREEADSRAADAEERAADAETRAAEAEAERDALAAQLNEALAAADA